NLVELAQSQAAEAELKWQAQYGDVVKIKALFGENRLLVSDPKALQYIHQTSGYHYPKQPERREISRLVSGRGILWADDFGSDATKRPLSVPPAGETHKRQRKIMLPGFSGPETKLYLPVFSACAAKMAEMWREVIASSGEESAVIDIPSWASRCTLDAIVAFDYQFQTLDHGRNELGQAFSKLLLETFALPTKPEIFVQNFFRYIPVSLREWVGDHIPSRKLAHARYTAKLSSEAAKDLWAKKSTGCGDGKDIMSLLVKADSSSNEKLRLNEEEKLGLMR
ncbi:hypothetical protein H0H93_013555, partial [Arthromyces matolae]